MPLVDNLTCGCDVTMPPVENKECNKEVKYAQIGYVIYGRDPWNDILLASEWTSRIDNDDVLDQTKFRIIQCIGSLTTEYGEGKEIEGGQKVYGKITYTLDIDIYNNSDINYEATRAHSCNKPLRFWPLTADGKHVYGANEGITMVIAGKEDISKSTDDFVVLNWKGQAKVDKLVQRSTIPIAITTNTGA